MTEITKCLVHLVETGVDNIFGYSQDAQNVFFRVSLGKCDELVIRIMLKKSGWKNSVIQNNRSHDKSNLKNSSTFLFLMCMRIAECDSLL